MTIFGYVRVSTVDQDNGPEAQRMAIKGRVQVDSWHEDRASGKSLDRPEIASILTKVKPGDTIVVAKLDRLSRSVVDAGTIMARAIKEGWNIIALDLGVDLSTPAGKMVASVVMAMAEFEREVIGQRIKEAMAVVKLRGTKSGKPIGKPRKYPPVVCERIRALHAKGQSLRQIGAEYNMAHQTVDRIVKRATH